MHSVLRNSGKKDTGSGVCVKCYCKTSTIVKSTKVGKGTWQIIGMVCNLFSSFDHLKMGEKDHCCNS